MYFDKIELVTDYQEVKELLNLKGINSARLDIGISKGVICNIISDEELLAVNIQVLNHDYYTDILTFDYTDDDDIEQHEILISWDRVQENAKTFQEPLAKELHRVFIHGLLHIAGHNDSTDEEKLKMRSLESHYLNLHCST